MQLTLLSPRKSLNKAYLKVKPSRSEIDLFKVNLIKLLDGLDASESEEHVKNDLSSFLTNTFFQRFYINTKGRNDLVIHNGLDAKSFAGVLIEAKKPSNKSEMIRLENLNAKAFHELILYYLRERITNHNLEIKHLVATNIYEWFVFDASFFEKLFAQNKGLVKQFNDFEERRLPDTSTDFFYKQIAEPFMSGLTTEICFTYFDFRTYDKPLRNDDKKDDCKLIALYKLLSPEHLLKLPFTNDSNSLDKAFYTELLHIIGLTETKEGSKKLIGRKKEGQRDPGSLIENAIIQIDSRYMMSRIEKPYRFGETSQDRLFNVSLELAITWINRILFLKLLEAQLINYHKGDPAYAFLNSEKLKGFDTLDSLFFRVLAKKPTERDPAVAMLFGKVPYLNSSLFEPTELERNTIFISNLQDDCLIPIHPGTVLKNNTGKRLSGNIYGLDYLFAFLDAYDFSGEGAEEIQEDNKTLINASVLGLIFEKINGYKDGSFFTPGFITMYMCHETIRRAVVQKFNDAKGWDCKTIDHVYDKIQDRHEANNIINSLKICDPAVGSGHFLVSALNEIIALKSDLNILQDREGRRLKEYRVEVVNDELIVTDEDGELFVYNPMNHESQRIQQTLFHEKQTIIENCLFGVDINPNSVKICRLRLWIELLKNAYYLTPRPPLPGKYLTPRPPLPDGEGERVLETLPNIDINIKCGNSLISRYALDADLKQVLSGGRFSIYSYRAAIMTYRNAENKEQKREMEQLIAKIKSAFHLGIGSNDPKIKKRDQIMNQIFHKFTGTFLFEPETVYGDEKAKEKSAKEQKRLEEEVAKLNQQIEDAKNNKIYENAFEWRYEFPEVLNDEGDFVGFDLVIENPPYVFAREHFDSTLKKYFAENFEASQYQVNLFFLFIEKSISILRRNGEFALIIPNSLLMVSSAKSLREYILTKTSLSEIINLMGYTFEGINVETIIFSGKNQKPTEENSIKIFTNKGHEFILNQTKEQSLFTNNEGFELNVFSDKNSDEIIKKINIDSYSLDNLVLIKAGLKAYEAGKGDPKQSPNDVKNRIYDYSYHYDDTTFEYLEGKDVARYFLRWSGTYLRYGGHLAAPRSFDIFKGKKIIIREITGKHPYCIKATYSENIYLFNMSNIAILERKNANISLKYILGLLNSRLISYYFIKNTAKSVRQMFPKLILEDLRRFPIKCISLIDQIPVISLVEQILIAKKINTTCDTSALEKEIDQLVYQLYGLTEEEIKLVEDPN